MPKHKKQTPQEIYRARREREEQERNALLPPGLYNHGNTCFMNSVLQGLIATPLLYDIAHPSEPSSSQHTFSASLISLQKSPLLTNGHGLGAEHEQAWVEGMPLGDVFINLMMKAWHIQRSHLRDRISPKEVLNAIGRKYDQYLDFAQQDAHEFLRQLLDAMSMEEMDIIKKRQPRPAPRKKRGRRTTITMADAHTDANAQHPIPESERLSSITDMIFGGRLTSILVCQSCKHISQTYEDFNDLSLSIKPEDYVRERKRDRLKSFAKRLTAFSALNVGLEMQRSTSLPPSPGGHSNDLSVEDPPVLDIRRRSADITSLIGDPEHPLPSPPLSAPLLPEPAKSLNRQSTGITNGTNEKVGKKRLSDDSWSKVGRRISLTVGLGRSKERRGRNKESDKAIPSLSEDIEPPEETTVAPMLVLQNGASDLIPSDKRTDAVRRPSSPTPPRSSLNSIRSSSRSSATSDKSLNGNRTQTKPSRTPKPSLAELKYLHRILADVPPANSNPFGLFRPPHLREGGTPSGGTPLTAASMWTKMGQVMGVEECLRLFTAVEVLDGENSVGCRRCWKIKHGVYSPRRGSESNYEDQHDEEESEETDDDCDPLPNIHTLPLLPPSPAPLIPLSLSSPTLPIYTHPNLSDSASISSLPTSATSISEPTVKHPPSPLLLQGGLQSRQTPGGLPIPSISTTAPDSPVITPSTARALAFPLIHTRTAPESHEEGGGSSSRQSSPTTPMPPALIPRIDREALQAPRRRRSRLSAESDTTDDSSDGEQSDASTTSAFSNASSPSLPSSVTRVDQPRTTNGMSAMKKAPKPPKPVLMCPAYKRYLIAVPPPVLVIHLKRFQQISKSHIMSFSHGFKKLDDFVTFPELLDLTPFLAPKKEDFGLGKKAKEINGHGVEDQERCLYRLYAVVVHIGNMLGGHYVAYTALPTPGAQQPSSSDIAGFQVPSPKRQWAYISDTVVRLTTLEEVLKAKAYLCMYERL